MQQQQLPRSLIKAPNQRRLGTEYNCFYCGPWSLSLEQLGTRLWLALKVRWGGSNFNRMWQLSVCFLEQLVIVTAFSVLHLTAVHGNFSPATAAQRRLRSSPRNCHNSHVLLSNDSFALGNSASLTPVMVLRLHLACDSFRWPLGDLVCKDCRCLPPPQQLLSSQRLLHPWQLVL